MKRLMIALMFAATTVFAAMSATLPTAAECTNFCQAILSIANTNLPAAQRYYEVQAQKLDLFHFNDTSDLTRWIDGRLGPAGIALRSHRFREATSSRAPFPIMASNVFENMRVDSSFPSFSTIARKYDIEMHAHRLDCASMEEIISVLNDYLALSNEVFVTDATYHEVSNLKSLIVKKGLVYVKRWLRNQGKSFVSTNGVNPVESPLRELATALNAPYFNGLNEWFSKMGVDAAVDASKLPDSSAVSSLKSKILLGERNVSAWDRYILVLCLGVDGYNAFVREYNGDAS